MQNDKSKTQILVIDDEVSILNLISIVISNRGYPVESASDGFRGLKLVKELRPALVLLDYMMPGMDGLQTLKKIRQEFPETYVIMFTGKGSEEIAVELMKAGASDYVLKPFSNHNLIERIETVLRIRAVEIANRELVAEREHLLLQIQAWNHQLEERIKIESEALEKAHAEVVQSQKLATLGYLAAGMAHEIRNPLNSIALFSQLLKEGVDDPENLEYIDKILKEVDRVDATLIKLLDTAKRPKFALTDVNLETVLHNALESFKPQTTAQRIKVEFSTNSLTAELKADPAELGQIFTNLFLNAIHEMPYGGVLQVGMKTEHGYAVITISDTGNGISKEHLPNIFDPFFTTKSSGTGMGLSVVMRIVNNYNGRIEVTSTGKAGTTFLIRLPLSVSVQGADDQYALFAQH